MSLCNIISYIRDINSYTTIDDIQSIPEQNQDDEIHNYITNNISIKKTKQLYVV